MTAAMKALHELREYFEQKRDLALRQQIEAETDGKEVAGLHYEQLAACWDHAMEMVATYLREIERQRLKGE